MLLNLKILCRIYKKLKNDHFRALVLIVSEKLHIRKDIVRLDTNDVCNIQCIMCTNKPCKATETRLMSYQDYTKLIDIIGNTTRFLYLSCSYEPLMTPGFADYVAYVKSKGIPNVSFATNGMLLAPKVIDELVKNQLTEIIISANGFDEKNYNRIMEKASWKVLIINLQYLKEIKQKNNTIYPKIRLNTILLKTNIENLENLFRFIDEYNIDSVQFRELMLIEGQNNPEQLRMELLKCEGNSSYEGTIKKIYSEIEKHSPKGITFMLPEHIHAVKEKNEKSRCSTPYFSY